MHESGYWSRAGYSGARTVEETRNYKIGITLTLGSVSLNCQGAKLWGLECSMKVKKGCLRSWRKPLIWLSLLGDLKRAGRLSNTETQTENIYLDISAVLELLI